MATDHTNIEDIYPLSPMQQGMLFHTLYGAREDPPLLQWKCRFEADVPALRRAWERVIERHAILRTAFVLEDRGEPVQVVFRSVPVPWQERDLRMLSPQDREQSVKEFLEQDRHTGFELLEPPLMRFTLIRLTDSTSVFVWTFHLLLLDGWSMGAVRNEVWASYEALLQGTDLQPPLPRPYRDYIAWHQRQDPARAEHFWRRTLRGIHAPTPLGVGRSAPGVADGSAGYEEREIRLSAAATRSLQEFARQHRLTLSTVVRAAWGLLLGRYSGEPTVVFGAAMSGRPADLPGVESIVGLLVNTLPVRVDIPENEPVRSWLQRLQEQQSELLDYESSRLVDVQGSSEVPRGLPLFESILAVQTYPVAEAVRSREQKLGIREVQNFERTNYPLTVHVAPGKELSLGIAYDRSRFDLPTIDRMLSHFENLLLRLASNPDQLVSNVSLLTDGERLQILREWNSPGREFGTGRCLHEAFESRAAGTPDAPAVELEGVTLTYAELNRRANRLARHLRKLGVERDVLVAVCLDRSLEMVVAILGILKAGGAYVPLDPAYPPDRLAFMVEDARAPILVTQSSLRDCVPVGAEVQLCLLDQDAEAIGQENERDLEGADSPESLAYVIYTSGSTGKPKGVLVTHRNVDRLFEATQAWFGFGASDVWTLFHSYAFDFSVWEIWGALRYGGKLVVVPQRVAQTPDAFRELLATSGVTVLNQTPSAFRQLISVDGSSRSPLKLRLVIFGGEALEPEMLTPWFERHGDASPQLVNMYGITETTVHVTYHPLSRSDVARPSASVVGRPIPDLQLYILDARGDLCPIGVPGELYVAGAGLARGYHDRPELTALRFIPNRFSDRSGDRLYRSGDLGRFRDDGEIEYLGRIDQQVKIRGHRIELGEIEAVISQHPSVREAVVVARRETPEDSRLVAYVVPKPDMSPSGAEIRAFLKRALPEYMLPSTFVHVDRIPLTPSGKIDRRALPAPDATRDSLESAFIAPHTPIEEMLTGIWVEVLKREPIGIHDNFFELGGHSVLATQVFSRIRDHFHVALPLRHLFEQPTIQGLAALIEAARAEGSGTLPPRLKRVSRDRELPLSFAQQRLWFLDQLEPGGSSYNSRYALRLKGKVDYVALQRALGEVVSRHESLRTRFEGREGRAVQVVLEAGDFALTVEDVSGRGEDAEKEALSRVSDEVKKPFDLARGPLFRANLLRLGPEDHIFLVVMHHIVCDGWSMGVFFRELEVLYGAFSRGESSPLPPLGLQYADYAVWERDWFQGEVLEKQLAYWTEQLRGAPPILDLRGDRPRPEIRSFRGARQRFFVSTSVAERIAALSRNEGVTLYMTLLAAFSVLLWRRTGQEEIVVGSPIFGRDRIETEGLIGFFINTIVLRIDLRGNPSFRELLSRVRETALGAYAHQDVPLERLVDALKLERSLSHNPLFQVWFVLQNAGGPPPKLEGLSVEEIPLETEAIRHDLQLSMSEAPAGLAGELEYATDIFEASTASRLAESYQKLLLRVLANPEISLGDLRGSLDRDGLRRQREKREEVERESVKKLKEVRRKVLRG